MKFAIFVIAIGACMCLGPAVIGTIEHGIKYGWMDALKIVGTVAWFVGGMAVIFLGFYLKSRKDRKNREKLLEAIEKIEP